MFPSRKKQSFSPVVTDAETGGFTEVPRRGLRINRPYQLGILMTSKEILTRFNP